MVDETKQIQVLIGPYRDHRLTVSPADADAAVNAHWAVDPFAPVDIDNPHPPLSEEERTAALEAAYTWARAQWDAAQAIEQPKEQEHERERQRQRETERHMAPEEGGRYQTREQTQPHRPRDRSSER